MKTLTLKPQHQDSAIAHILTLKSQLEYHKHEIAPLEYQMADWEKKEYAKINEDNQTEFNNLKSHIIANESVFNELLSDYNLSVVIFIHTYILN